MSVEYNVPGTYSTFIHVHRFEEDAINLTTQHTHLSLSFSLCTRDTNTSDLSIGKISHWVLIFSCFATITDKNKERKGK